MSDCIDNVVYKLLTALPELADSLMQAVRLAVIDNFLASLLEDVRFCRYSIYTGWSA